MPRSPIRTPSPELDFSDHFLSADALPDQVDSRSIFGNDQPLEIEVGSGKGLFMATASADNPSTNFLGIEVANKYAQHAAARLARSGVANAKMLSGDAGPILKDKVPSQSLQGLHVYFPDPWWKKRHRKRRVVNEQTIPFYVNTLQVGGRWHFWTDVLDYFLQTIEMIAEIAPEMGVPIPEEEAESTHDLDYRTHFERRSRKHNIPVYRVRYQKREHRETP